MKERLKFGRPDTPAQAILRLPTREHPDYEITTSPIEHLTHFNEWLTGLVVRFPAALESPLLDREIPLEYEDVRLMEKFSFSRQKEERFTVQWGFIRKNNELSLIFPSGSDNYRWWQISRVVPKLDLPRLSMICVETNRNFSLEDTEYRFNENSEFSFLLLTSEELANLKEKIVGAR